MIFFTRLITSHLLIFLFLLVITTIIYIPALDSNFYIDDYANLGSLDLIELKGYNYFIFSGISGSSGRPLSLATFALQHDYWPDNPFAFKAVNLAIHLCIGALIHLISRLLARQLFQRGREITTLSLIVTALWLLHPIQLYTVLYAVQRMTQLSTLFVLLGITGYLYSRQIFSTTNAKHGLIGMSLSVAGAMVLGILAKENAILLPVYIFAIEMTFFSGSKRSRAWTLWAGTFLFLPVLLLIAYLVISFDEVLINYSNRAFTPGERVLTQTLVLFDYLKSLLFPHPSLFSLYHDDYAFSEGLMSPPHTLIAVIGVCVMLIGGCASRKRWPVISFAIFWFFGGHALEASHLNLELYFEHRNYLPAYGIFFLLAWLIISIWKKLAHKMVTGLLLGVYGSLILFSTISEIKLWSDPVLQANEWVRYHPQSPRALDNIGNIYVQYGQFDKAIAAYHQVEQYFPNEVFPYIREIMVRNCVQGEELGSAEWDEILKQAEKAEWHWNGVTAEIDRIVHETTLGRCDSVNTYYLMILIIILANNEEYKDQHDILYETGTTLSLHMNDGISALEYINKSIELSPTIFRKIYKLKILLALNRITEAKQLLSEIRRALSFNPRMLLAYKGEIRSLEEQYRTVLK